MGRSREPNPNGTWSCNLCGENLPAEKFYADQNTGKPKARCKECHVRRTIEIRKNSNCDDQTAPFIPTPEQIAAGTAKLRSSWSEKMHRARAGLLSEYEVDVAQNAFKIGDSI